MDGAEQGWETHRGGARQYGSKRSDRLAGMAAEDILLVIIELNRKFTSNPRSFKKKTLICRHSQHRVASGKSVTIGGACIGPPIITSKHWVLSEKTKELETSSQNLASNMAGEILHPK